MAALKRLRTGARIALAAALVFASGAAWAQTREASVTIHADKPGPKVQREIFGQMINVLQAMILTDGDKMVVTPTYQVFGMYVPWQDATQLPVDQTSPWYNKDQWTMASLNTSAVRGADGAVHVSLANLDPVNALTVTLNLDGGTASTLSGKVLTADRIDAHNRIGEPLAVAPRDIAAVPVTGGKVVLTLPAKSVTVVALK